MKSVLFALATLTAMSAFAAPTMTPSDAAREAIDMSMHCQKELTKLSKIGFISSVSFQQQIESKEMTIVISTGGLAPVFQTKEVAQLLISRTAMPGIQAPDAPGKLVYSCQVTRK